MKALYVVLIFLGFTLNSYAQENVSTASDLTNAEELPEVVIKRTGNDYSMYLPDKNPDINIRKLQRKFSEHNLGNAYEGFDDYFVTMESKDGILAAHYDSKGKLINVVEKYKNVRLPNAVIYSIIKEFPQWAIMDDKFEYRQKEGEVIKKQYSIKIKKGNETKKIVVNTKDGVIIAGL